jgi:OmpA-OmpF porin, OOP family
MSFPSASTIGHACPIEGQALRSDRARGIAAMNRQREKSILGAVIFLAATALGPNCARAQEWLLNAAASHFYMQTAKANAIIETHQFTGLDGTISKDGDANIKIDLTSVASGIDVRDVRMRFLLFETYKFPYAEVKAKLDMAKLQAPLTTTIRIPYDLKLTVDLHGFAKEIEAPVTVTRVSDNSVSVASAKPIIVNADTFGLVAGIAKLAEAVNGTPIVAAASFSFDLLFETGDKIPALQLARAEAASAKTAAETSAIAPEGCQTRFSVISAAQAIYFKTRSAELDTASEPLLDSVADIARRCGAVRIEVTGHTDSVGLKAANQRLSEERAHSVVTYLVQHGVGTQRIDSAGYGDTRPIAPNDTEANRARNRRIEFRVKSQ